MKRKSVALLQAIGSVIALSPTVVSANGMPANPVSALRQDAAAIRGDFQKAMVSVNVEKAEQCQIKKKVRTPNSLVKNKRIMNWFLE
ncbi:MAG: hypothetical protein ACLTCG_02490 [Escherichia coli]